MVDESYSTAPDLPWHHDSGNPQGFSEATAPFLLPQDDASFLTASGMPHLALGELARRASAFGVGMDDIAHGEGARAERLYYRAVARALDLPFIDLRQAKLADEAFTTDILATPLTARILPVIDKEQRLYAVLPRAGELAALARSLGTPHGPQRLAIAAPCDAREALLAQAGARLIEHHIHPLRRQRPDLSASDTPRRAALFLALALTALSGGVAGIAAGALSAEMAGAAFAVAMAIIFGIALGLRCAILGSATNAAPPPPSLPDRDLPFYTVLVPVYREAAIMPQLLAALAAIDYPPARLEVLFLVEADDAETPATIRRGDPQERYAILTVPPGLPKTKPRALQLGLAFARGDIVTIYDAEDVPAPDQLRCAAATLAAGDHRLACVQAPLAIDNAAASWLARQFALEYAALFRVIVPGLARLAMPVMLGGTSNHFRTTVLREVMGWDPWNVTEDADLGLRLARFGYRTTVIAAGTQEEAPATLASWFGQRRRWLKGWMQTALVHLASPTCLARDLSWRGTLAIIGTLVATLIAALIYPLSVIATILLVADAVTTGMIMQPLLIASALILFIAGHAMAIALIAAGIRGSGLTLRLYDIAGLPFYWGLVSLAAWAAMVDLMRSPFHWVKTDHVGRAARRL